ncbi:MAG: ATP-dependent DNA ligase, partial [Gemmatimonadales bacterium]|nr:ATP-dependent DNA ligase [Gemmatimonadales bacterium]
LTPLQRRTSPFAPGPVPAGTVRWVTPRLVAQVGFAEWTSAGVLRHPRFLGLRDDKPARAVRRD